MNLSDRVQWVCPDAVGVHGSLEPIKLTGILEQFAFKIPDMDRPAPRPQAPYVRGMRCHVCHAGCWVGGWQSLLARLKEMSNAR